MAVTIGAAPAVEGREQLERILQSRIFRASEVLRNLLAYLSEKALTGTADSLKEYTIGLDALGKPASFDPRQESVVRMHTARLRQKLAEYYRTEGIDDPIIIDLPKGGFRITFEPRPQVAPPPDPLPTAVPTPVPTPVEVLPLQHGWQPREIALAAALMMTLVCAAYFMIKLWRVERTDAGRKRDNRGSNMDTRAARVVGSAPLFHPQAGGLRRDAPFRRRSRFWSCP